MHEEPIKPLTLGEKIRTGFVMGAIVGVCIVVGRACEKLRQKDERQR